MGVHLALSTSFGLLLKRHRRAAGLTQEELAERAGLSPRAVGDLERDLRQPRRDTLQLLIAALQLGPEEQARLESAARADPALTEGRGLLRLNLQPGNFLGAAPPGPLVGRRHELERLRASVDAAAGGAGRLVLLTGEPGIGKTRLAQETFVELGRRGFLVASGRCYEPDRDVPVFPFLEVMASAFAATPRPIRDEIPARWPQLELLLPPDTLAGTRLASVRRRSEPGEEQRLFWSVSGFLTAIAGETPVAVLIDDLHWADDATLKLLLHLARRTRTEKVFLLGTYRDVEVGPTHALAHALVDLNRERLVERVTVRRLDESGTANLIAGTLGEREVSEQFSALVHRATNGNPFFIQEVLLALLERGDVLVRDDRWTCRDLYRLETPDTVRAAIAERLGRLSSEAQVALSRASVLGQTFAFDELRVLGNSSEEQLEDALGEAVAAGLVREQGTGGYAFGHALTQQSIYEDLSVRRRQGLHLAAAEMLLRLAPDAREQRVAELARHLREAGDTRRAVEYTLQAGGRAIERFAYGEAERLFRTVLDLIAAPSAETHDPTLQARALAQLGRVLDHAERYDEALDVLEQAAGMYRGAGDIQSEGAAVAEIGWLHHNRGSDAAGLDRVLPLVKSLEAEPLAGPGTYVLAALYTALSRLYFGLGRYADELRASARAVELGRIVGDPILLSVAESRHGSALMSGGRHEEARAALERAIGLAEATGNLGTLTVALDNLGEIARDAGDYLQALQDCRRAAEVAETTGVPGRMAWTLTKLGRMHMLLGEWAEARAVAERALSLLADDPTGASHARMYLGQLDLLEGSREAGRAQVEEAMRACEPGRDLWLRWLGSHLLAEQDLLDGQPATAIERIRVLVEDTARHERRGSIAFTLLFPTLASAHFALGRVNEAEAALQQGMERAETSRQQAARADMLRVLGMLRVQHGRLEEGREAIAEAIELVRPMPDPFREAHGLFALGSLEASAGNRAQSQACLEAARTIFRRLGARPYLRLVQRELDGLGRE